MDGLLLLGPRRLRRAGLGRARLRPGARLPTRLATGHFVVRHSAPPLRLPPTGSSARIIERDASLPHGGCANRPSPVVRFGDGPSRRTADKVEPGSGRVIGPSRRSFISHRGRPGTSPRPLTVTTLAGEGLPDHASPPPLPAAARQSHRPA